MSNKHNDVEPFNPDSLLDPNKNGAGRASKIALSPLITKKRSGMTVGTIENRSSSSALWHQHDKGYQKSPNSPSLHGDGGGQQPPQ